MPFTFSHPAIILPFINKRKKILSATGLIIGSIAPDFESFMHVNGEKIYSHTWGGMFWFDLPLALILSVIFHLVIRDPLIQNLPLPLEERFTAYLDFNWMACLRKHLFIVLISLLAGIATHLLWDAFTHLNLRNPDSTSSTIEVGHIRLYIILQYSCSLIGLLVIALYVYKLPRIKIKQVSRAKFKFWLFVLLIAIMAGICLGARIYVDQDIVDYMKRSAITIIYVCIFSLLTGLGVVSFIYILIVKKGNRKLY